LLFFFFPDTSHEIRTPLNCIVGLSHLLTGEVLPEEHRDSIDMIATSSELLLAIVNDVLDYSKLETESGGIVQTQIQPTVLSQHLKAVVTSLSTQAEKANLEIRYTFHDNVPDVMETDGRRLQQILYNLLGNSVKFGKTGQYIDFSVQMNENRDCVEFSVTDYGKGIAKEEQKRIFEPFQQAATNEVQHGGTGLGLAVTHKLVKVLGGKISLESEYGNYTTFRVVLPLKQKPVIDEGATAGLEDCTTPAVLTGDSMSEGAPTESPTKPRPVISPKLLALNSSQQPAAIPTTPFAKEDFFGFKVLIAEDNLVNQKVLTRTLQRLGITDVDVVDNGQKAVDSWNKRDYKIIFMDLQVMIYLIVFNNDSGFAKAAHSHFFLMLFLMPCFSRCQY
jgi:CheY-like chemotaxis protein